VGHRTIVGLYGGKWGRPGVGKTTVAGILASERSFVVLSLTSFIAEAIKNSAGQEHVNRQSIDRVCRMGRKISEDFWLNLAMQKLGLDANRIVLDDLYFENEYRMVKDHNGLIIKVIRPGIDEDDYGFEPDVAIRNDATLDHLKQRVLSAIDTHLQKKVL